MASVTGTDPGGQDPGRSGPAPEVGPAGSWTARHGARVAVWTTRVTRLVALLSVLSVLVPVLRKRLEPAAWFGLPEPATVARTVLVAAAAVGLYLLVTGLRRRKRRAWQLATALSVLLLLAHLIERRPVLPALVVAVLLVGLLLSRREFVALPDPVGRSAALRVVVQLLGAGFLIVTGLLFVRPRLLVGDPSVGQRLAQAALSLVGVSGPVAFRAGWLDDVTAAIGLTFGIAALLLGGYFLLRSAEPRPRRSDADTAALRRLLAEHGAADSLGYFALRADKAVVFSASGKAAVAYRVVAGVALVSGDPLGDREAWPAAMDAYRERCRRYGWVPAALGCSEEGARRWVRQTGMDALALGDEAVVDAATFSLQGRSMRGVRQAVSRVRRSGYETSVRRLRDIDPDDLAAVRAAVHAWRGGPDERGFSMALSRVADLERDPDAVLVTTTAEGELRGVLQFVPWGADGLSLDLMVRDRVSVQNGVSELLITDLLAACKGLGVVRVSLNFAVFRSALAAGERIGAGPVDRLWARILHLASRWWQIESLYRFNSHFDPQWVPRLLVFDAVRDLPRVAVAAFEAEGYGGRPPALLRLLRR